MNKSYCAIPFTEIYVDNAGTYRLCCHAGLSGHKDNESLPFDYFHSEYMEDIRDKMMSGKIVHECMKCYHMEVAGKYSFRQEANRKHGLKADIEDVRLKLRINGSSCNLACYMCQPFNSSERRKELREIYGDDWENKIIHFTSKDIPVKRDIWRATIENINEHIELIDKIHMTGGEPLQLKRHWDWIDAIPDEYAKRINLSYDSNITQLEFKGRNVLELKDKFKDVYFGISCDHYGEKLKYLRYPINVEEFEKNLKVMIANYRCKIHTTATLLNIDDLNDVEKYYQDNFNVPTKHMPLTRPDYMSIRNVPRDQKEFYRDAYKDHPLLISELNKAPIDGWYEKLTKYLDDLYGHRGLEWRKLFDVKKFEIK